MGVAARPDEPPPPAPDVGVVADRPPDVGVRRAPTRSSCRSRTTLRRAGPAPSPPPESASQFSPVEWWTKTSLTGDAGGEVSIAGSAARDAVGTTARRRARRTGRESDGESVMDASSAATRRRRPDAVKELVGKRLPSVWTRSRRRGERRRPKRRNRRQPAPPESPPGGAPPPGAPPPWGRLPPRPRRRRRRFPPSRPAPPSGGAVGAGAPSGRGVCDCGTRLLGPRPARLGRARGRIRPRTIGAGPVRPAGGRSWACRPEDGRPSDDRPWACRRAGDRPKAPDRPAEERPAAMRPGAQPALPATASPWAAPSGRPPRPRPRRRFFPRPSASDGPPLCGWGWDCA